MVRMRWIAALVCMMAGAAVAAAPERLDPVSVGIAFENTAFVIGEDIPARVLVRNNTSQTLTLGRGTVPAGVLDVSHAGDPRRESLALDKGGCIPRPLTLRGGEERVFDINIAQASNLRRQGKYFVTFGAIVGGYRYDTKVRVLEIVPGTPVSEGVQMFTRDPRRQRRLSLVRWPRGHIDRLFLRIEDTPDGRYFPTVMIGAYLPLVKPRMNIADNGEIMVMHRATPEYYVRNVFWSLPNDFVRRSTQKLLDPATADTARLNGLRKDLDEVIEKNEKLKEALRLR